MTKQEIFSKVKKHLLAQMKKSMRESPKGRVCAYRGENNTSCSVGCLISDSEYKVNMEGYAVNRLLNNFNDLVQTILPNDLNEEEGMYFLVLLQEIHDMCPVSDWKYQLEKLESEQSL